MTSAIYASRDVPVDVDGFLRDPSQWTEEMAVDIAAATGVPELTERHWQVIRFMRHQYETKGAAPNVRALATMSGIPIRELYQLFPKGPAKLAAKIAGVPKPHGCI